MKKTVVIIAVLLIPLSTFAVLKSSQRINGQIIKEPEQISIPSTSVKDGTSTYNLTSILMDQTVIVPETAVVAQVKTPNKTSIKVQRFIDPTTNVACYMTETMMSCAK